MNDDQLNVNTVAGSGYLDGYACWSSYGCCSPVLDDNYGYNVVCRVESDGDVDNFWFVDDSYGIK